eukprot:6571827-Alexandrium_andersonii.AAC.1
MSGYSLAPCLRSRVRDCDRICCVSVVAVCGAGRRDDLVRMAMPLRRGVAGQPDPEAVDRRLTGVDPSQSHGCSRGSTAISVVPVKAIFAFECTTH